MQRQSGQYCNSYVYVPLSSWSFISNNLPKDPSFENYKVDPIEKLLINFQHAAEFIFINLCRNIGSFFTTCFNDQ